MKIASRKTGFFLLAGMAILALLAWSAFREPAQLSRVAVVAPGPLTQYITEEGKTRLKERYRISAPVSGHLRRISLQPGDAVQAGQPLAYLDPVTSGLLDARARAQAQAELGAGQSQQQAAQQRIRAARAAHQLAVTSLKRTEVLRKANSVSQEALDQARTRASTTRAELAAARANERAAVQRVAAARAMLAEEGRTGELASPLTMTAPVDGVVLSRAVESAGPVQAGQLLMEIGDTTRLEVQADVLSTDAVRLSPGMQARIVRWGGEGTLAARVLRVEPGGFTKTSALGVEEQRTRVILDITTPHAAWAALGDAYRVELEFILKHEDEALQVPASALFRLPGNEADGPAGTSWALYRLEDDVARLVPVKVGLRSARAVQILAGVSAGERVIVQPDDRIRDGTRIEVH